MPQELEQALHTPQESLEEGPDALDAQDWAWLFNEKFDLMQSEEPGQDGQGSVASSACTYVQMGDSLIQKRIPRVMMIRGEPAEDYIQEEDGPPTPPLIAGAAAGPLMEAPPLHTRQIGKGTTTIKTRMGISSPREPKTSLIGSRTLKGEWTK